MNWNITIRKNYLFGFCFLLLTSGFTWNTNPEQETLGFSLRTFKQFNGLVQQQLAIDPLFTECLEFGENNNEEVFNNSAIVPDATCSGNANAVFINTGVVSATNALNGADDTEATLNDSGDQLGLDLNDILQSGATYTIRWRRNTGTSSNPSFTVEESTDGATWGAADGSPFTVTSTAWADNNFTANTDTRYIRITTTDVYDLDVDAITYTSVECLDLETSSTESTTPLSFVGVECGNTATTTITVPENITISDINIGLNVSLDYRHHLTATVTSPNGTTVELTSNGAYSGGSSTINDWDVLFDDASSNSLNDGDSDDVAAPYYESERIANPSGTLSAFNGENSSGVWTLAVCDAVTSTINGGTVNRWKIDITGITPCSATADAPITTIGTCNGVTANDDGVATINNITNADKIGISSALASSYDGPDYASASAISGSSHIFSNLEQGKNYIIRVYESGGGACHSDISFITADPPAACPGLPSGLPWSGSQCAGKEIIFQNGVGILTCGVTASTSNADRYTVALMDFTGTVPSSGRTETTSSVDVYHHPSWHVDSIGNVFGTTINTSTGEMLVAASSNYGGGFLGNDAVIRYGALAGGTANGTNDAAAGGAVYKIDASTGQASVFALLPQQATDFVNDDCESSDVVTRTNSGVGLGNLVYDEINNQYFVTNIEDGRIYRLGSDGTILDSYDPFGNDDGNAGISDLEELVYGLAIEPGTSNLFFGGVDDAPDSTDYATAGFPTVHSITLTSSGGFPGTVNNTTLPSGAAYSNYENATETLHITVPTGGGSSFADNYVYLISDLAFNQNDQLVIAVRVGCENSFFTSYNHWAETSIVDKNSSTGQYSDNLFEFDITHTGSAGIDDSYGGVSTYVDNSGNNFIAGSAADILQESGPHGIAVFNDPPAAGQIDPLAAVSYGVVGSDPKGVGGDIDIFTECIECKVNITNTIVENCTGTNSFTADLKVIVSWEHSPSGEDILITYDGGSAQTIPVSTTGTSPDTVTISIPADGSKGHQIIATFATTTDCADTLSITNPVPCPADVATCSGPSTGVGGNVFEDYNYDGTDAGTIEPGVQGVKVYAYDCDGNKVDSAYTDSDGDYLFNTTGNGGGLTLGAQYRIEFDLPESIACWAEPTLAGTANGTTVQFVTEPACASLGISSPSYYCGIDNPDIVIACYENGDGSSNNNVSMLRYKYNNTGIPSKFSGSAADPTDLSTIAQMGTVWGAAYYRETETVFATAFLKRHVSLGPVGLGGVYMVNPTSGYLGSFDLEGVTPANGGAAISFGNITRTTVTNQIDAGVAGNNQLSSNTNEATIDLDAFAKVGGTGMGDTDIEFGPDKLWTINLNTTEAALISIDLADAANPLPTNATQPPSAIVNRYLISEMSPPSCTNGVFRPWAIGFNKGKGYVGGVCSAENGGTTNDLKAYVLSFDPANPVGGFTEVVSFDLDFNREFKSDFGHKEDADWQPWADAWSDLTFNNGRYVNNASPIFSDIEFRENGDLVLGFMDRYSHQLGYQQYEAVSASQNNGEYDTESAGDIYHICLVNGTYIPEGGVGCPTNDNETTIASALTNDGISGTGEYYWEDVWRPSGDQGHGETASGALSILKGTGFVISSALDPVEQNGFGTANTQGSYKFNMATGGRDAGYMIINNNGTDLGKSGGLSDLVLICESAPLEIGNYVWLDTDEDGIQDACELPLENVIIKLYNAAGEVVAIDTTNSKGEYYFNDVNIDAYTAQSDTTLLPNMAYIIVVMGSTEGDFTDNKLTISGTDYELTTQNATDANTTDSDLVDSDGAISGNPVTAASGMPFTTVTTGNAGQVNHSLDFGFKPLACELSLSYTQSNCTDNNDGTFTATYDVTLTWSGAPSTGDLTLALFGDGTLNTTTVSAATITGGSTTTLTNAFTVPADGNGTTGILVAFDNDLTCKDSVGFKAPVPCPSDVATCASTSGCIGGNIFEDYNCNGIGDTNEGGVQGIEIQIYDCDNNLVGTGFSDAEGDWQLCGLIDGVDYRIEFVLPESVSCWATPTHVAGSGNQSDVQFLTAPACTQFSVSSPADYCEPNPLTITSCYTKGTQTEGLDVLVGINYDESGTVQHMALDSMIGSTYGLAYQRSSKSVFAASVLKRKAGFAKGQDGILHTEDDISSIYVLDYSSPGVNGIGTVSHIIDLADFGVNVGLNPRANSTPANDLNANGGGGYDYDVFENVAKRGIGDIDISADDKTLYVVNINSAGPELIILDISNPSSPTLIQKASIPNPGCSGGDSYAPWALKVKKGEVYVGTVCTADVTKDNANLRAYVQLWNGSGFTNVDIDRTSTNDFIALDYDRACAYWFTNDSTCEDADWQYWRNDPTEFSVAQQYVIPQPILTDIEFGADGAMILGFMDRLSNQLVGRGPDTSVTTFAWTISAGELLYLCNSGTAETPSYSPEGSGGCAQNFTPPYYGGNPTIPSRHFNTVSIASNASEGEGHGEISNGGLAVLPGSGQVVFTAMNPEDFHDTGDDFGTTHYNSGGFRWVDEVAGTTQANYTFYSGGQSFGKNQGLGDVEFLCAPAPLEIGNYVWCDSLQNGIQDACERGIADIKVQLYDRNGALVGVTTTSAAGQYYFNENNVDTTGVDAAGTANTAYTGMGYEMQYFIVFGDAQFTAGEFNTGSETFGITSMVNVGSNDNIDSDVDGSSLTAGSLGARPDGLPFIDMTTSATGCGDHKYDMGVTCEVPCSEINQLIADRTICSGDAIDSLAATTTFTNPDSIAFVYFTTQQTDSSLIYTGGTGIDTLQISVSSDTVLMTNLTIGTFTATTNPDTFYVYAIKHPISDVITCRPYEEILIIINPTPDLVTTDTTICNGVTIDLTNRVTDNNGLAGTMTWHGSAADATNGANSLASSVLPITTTRYYVRKVTDTHSCVNIDSTLITVQDAPNLSTTDQTVCVGISVNLSTLVTDNASTSGTVTYHNNLVDAESGSNNLGSNLTPGATTKYYIRKSTTTGSCVDIDSLTITIQPLPDLATTDATICHGTSIDLDNQVVDNNSTTGSQSYFLSLADANAGANIQSNPVSPTVTTTYFVKKITTIESCTNIASLTITVQPLPNLTTRDTTLCNGQPVDLANQTTDEAGTTGTMTYHTTLADAQSGGNVLGSTIVNPSTDTKYYARKVTTVASCVDIDSIAITIQALPDLVPTDSTICNGISVDLSGLVTDNNTTTGTLTFHNALADAEGNTGGLGSTTVTPSSTTKYYLRKETTTANCVDLDSLTITVQPAPDLAATDAIICAGAGVDLSGQVVDNANTTGTTTFHNTLADAEGNTSALASATVNPSATTKYYVLKTTTTANCTDLDSLTITVQAVPNLLTKDSLACAGADIELTGLVSDNANTTGTTTYHNTLADAQTGSNALGSSTVNSTTTTKYYARKETTTANCTAVDSLTISRQPLPDLVTLDSTICATNAVDLAGLVTDNAGTTGTVTFHSSSTDAQLGMNPLGSSTVSPTSTTTYHIRKETTTGSCYVIASLIITVQSNPDLVTTDATICNGVSINLTNQITDNASTIGTMTYHNSLADAQNKTNGLGSTTVLPSVTTKYYIQKTTATTNCQDLDSLTITVQPLPDLLTSNVSICEGESVDLVGRVSDNNGTIGTTTFHNSLAEAQSASNVLGSTTVSPTTTTKYYVSKITTTASCAAVDSISINVQALPALNTENDTLCIGQNVDISTLVTDASATTGTMTYHPTLLDAQGNSNPLGSTTVSPTVTTEYYVRKETTTGNCVDLDSLTIVMESVPNLSTTDTDLCAGESVDLTTLATDNAGLTGTMTYHASLADAQSGTSPLGSTDVTPVATTKYYVRKTAGTQICLDIDSINVAINPLPADAINPVNGASCNGGTISTLQVDDPGAGFNVTWWNASTGGSMVTGATLGGTRNEQITLSASSSPAAPVVGNTTTVYAEILNTTTNCISANRVAVTLTNNELPEIVNITPMVCAGEMTTMSATITGGTTPYTYLWEIVGSVITPFGGNATSTATMPVFDASGLANNTYMIQLSLTDNNGCMVQKTFDFVVQAGPDATFSNLTDEVCEGDMDVVYSVEDQGAGAAYGWTFTNASVVSGGMAADTFIVVNWDQGGTTGNINVNITLASGCTGQNQTTVTIHPKPVITAASNSPICAGDTLKLSSTTTGGTAGFNYAWTGPNTFTANVENPIIVDATIAATGSYEVIVTDVNTCADTATVNATVEQVPVLTTRDTTVCPNESVDLSSLFVDDNNTAGTTTYYNTLADAEGMTNAISSTVTTAITDKYYLRKIITNVPNCTVIDSIEVTIQPNPDLSTTDALICDGVTVDLSTLVTDNANTTGTLTYHNTLADAQSGVGDIGNAQSPTTTTKYYVLKTTSTVACTNVDSLTITVQDLPDLVTLDSTICGNETVDLTGLVSDNATTTGTTTFHTSLVNANNGSGAISNNVTPVISTKYYVRKETTVGTCVEVDSMTITLQTVPNLNTRDTLVCDGQSVELTSLFTDDANTTGTTTFHTSKSNAEGNIAALGSTLVTPNFTSKYYIRKGTTIGTCVDIDSMVVNLQPLPNLATTNTLICVGASIDLSTLVTDNANTTGTLSYHNNLTDAQNGDNAISATQSPSTNTQYFILKTTTDAACIDVAAVVVNVQALPNLTTRDSTICAEQAVDLSILVADNAATTGTTTFHTTYTDAMAGTGSITNTVTPSATTKYYIRKITTGSNCLATDSLTITLQTNPILDTRDSLICVGASVELTILVNDAANTTGTTSFYSNLADAQSESNALGGTNVMPSSTTKFYVRKETTTATCTDMDSLTITIQDLPDLATTNPIICAGENVDLSTLVTDNVPTTGTLTYHATLADAQGGTNDIGNSQTPASDTKYYVLKTTTAGACTTIDSVAVTVQPVPNLTPRDTTICGAETVDLSTLVTDDAGTVGTTTFHNLLADANNGANALSTAVTPSGTTKFYIRKMTTTASCPTVDSLTVNIVTMADLVTRDSSICAGESADLATLFTDNAGTTGTMAYYATLADAGAGTNAISNTITPATTTKYYLSKSVGTQNCLSVDSLTITILPLPDLATSTTTVCPSENVDLSTLVTDNAATMGTMTYHNSLADAMSSSNNIGANQNLTATTKYYIRKITTNNCLDYDSLIVTVQDLPNLTVLPGAICAGGSIDLHTLATDDAGTTGTLTCHSTLEGALNGTGVIVSSVSPAVDTKYYLRKITTTASCIAVDSVTVSILPGANIIGRDTSICDGFVLDLKTLLSGTVSGSIKYGTSFGVYPDTISTLVTLNGTQTYFIENEIGGGCIDTTMLTVTAVSCDIGDLPDTSAMTNHADYQTLVANNGPVHVIIPGLSLGATVDNELEGQPSGDALGDGADEDGLTIFSTLDLKPGITFRLPLTVTNETMDTAHVEAWIDWNGDGDFDDANEMVADLKDGADGNFPTLLSITVPAGATNGLIGVRIRISNEDNMTPYGFAPSGEIEDYLIGIQCPSIICIPAKIEIQKDR